MMWGVCLACACVASLATATAPAAFGPVSSPEATCAAPKEASAGASAFGRDHSMLQVTRGAVAVRGARDVHASEDASESPSPAKLDAELETADLKPIPPNLALDVPIEESSCNPERLRNAKVVGVWNIVGGVHEALVVHLELQEGGQQANEALLMEWGEIEFTGEPGTYSRVSCAGMTWKGPPTTVDVASIYGNCLSDVGRALGSSTTSWSMNTMNEESDCPKGKHGRRGNTLTTGWKPRNSMDYPAAREPADAGKPMREIQPAYRTHGKVVDEAVRWVADKHQDYSFLGNNCQDFATHMFTKITGSRVKTDLWCHLNALFREHYCD